MSKRTRDEADAAVDAGEVVSKKLKKDKKDRKEKKEKKSKTEEDVVVASGNGVEAVATDDKPELSKEERKALKRAKKEAAKAAEAQQAADNVADATGDDEAAAKAEKKARKKAEKAAKLAAKTPESNGEGHVQTSAHITGAGKSEADKYYADKQIAIEDSRKENTGPILSFDSLPFDADSKKAFFGDFKEPSPIQAATWPYLFNGRDVIGVAETGSGKTYGFGVPCINRLVKEKKIQVCIVSPTRELALQIQEQMVKLTKPRGLKATCVYGGTNKDEQRQQLKGTHIVVATPGRLNDFIGDGTIDLSGVTYLVLDEADRMLDKGFEQDIRNIISSAAPSQKRQTVMFTATWPDSVRKLASEFLKEPVRIMIGENASGELRANTRIKQEVEVLGERGKQDRMLNILKQYQSGKNKNDRILVFCLYKKEATRVEETIRRRGFRVAGIHGDLSQVKREESLAAFKKGEVPILVATDVAARGLDIPAVKLVLNVTFPLTVEDYVHRIGRTGRAGQDGHAITFFTDGLEKPLSGALINVLKGANQPVPEELMKFGTTVKKKAHDAYGAFYKDPADMKAATKITFD
ncbi:putative ATP-dependent RNA helicase DEAD-box, Helicase superfamily 1/2, ATP-binding protein [Septoria linicola]|nr:putative ATP-dependent RNA helicase DEAD-box, Helicase superfamily 1/2, ATP-binding protein [Septoria linicola]